MTPTLDAPTRDSPLPLDEVINDALHAVRTLLGMQVAFVSEFQGGYRYFRYVDSEQGAPVLRVGDCGKLGDSYCQRVVEGKLPQLMRDATHNAEAMTLPVTASMPVGAHLSVPIRFTDGQIYGTFCCFSTRPDETLTERDLGTMRIFAEFVGRFLEWTGSGEADRKEATERLRKVLDKERFNIVYQPIVDLTLQLPRGHAKTVVGYEALTRFLLEPVRTPDLWFKEASEVGLLEELELAVIRKALEGFWHLPAGPYLSLNASPETILKGSVAPMLEGYPLERLVLEVTEHMWVKDYDVIARKLEPLRKKGLRVAVDDAGAGYASFRHILKLKPEIIKLDSTLIRSIDTDVECRALAAALIRFAEETGSKILAEGVETEAELKTLRELRVNNAQGFLLGRPAALSFVVSGSLQHQSQESKRKRQ